MRVDFVFEGLWQIVLLKSSIKDGKKAFASSRVLIFWRRIAFISRSCRGLDGVVQRALCACGVFAQIS